MIREYVIPIPTLTYLPVALGALSNFRAEFLVFTILILIQADQISAPGPGILVLRITCVPSPPGLLLHFPVSVHVVYSIAPHPPKTNFKKISLPDDRKNLQHHWQHQHCCWPKMYSPRTHSCLISIIPLVRESILS